MTYEKKSSAKRRRAVGIIDQGENRRGFLWYGFEFCYKALALDCRYVQAIWSSRRTFRRRERIKKRENENGGLCNATTLLSSALISLEL